MISYNKCNKINYYSGGHDCLSHKQTNKIFIAFNDLLATSCELWVILVETVHS
jgi:hypothetical protein